SLEYHRNYSMENYGTCDSLDYTLMNYCWGHFLEVGISTNELVLFDTCSYNVPIPEGNSAGSGSSRHVGSTVTMIDEDGDSVMDLLLGDVTFDNVVLATNGGTLPNQNSSIIAQDTAFPSYDTPVDLTLFPGIFIEDIDNDGIKDMVVSPNTAELAQNYESMWYYRNKGTNLNPNFEFVKKDLLQDEMIELGENSIPELFDYNADGLMDLIVSNYGYFNRDSITYDCKLSLYKNVGTALNPMFQFITEDYQNISALKLGNSLHPTFGDIDGDGDEDMILGNSEGYLHLFDNTAGSGNTASFSISSYRLQDYLGDTIDVGQFSAPQLFDYDNDGDLDLVIGKVNGSIRYYENTGTTTAYDFKRITDSMGKVEIHEVWDLYGAATGFCTPRFVRDGSTVTLYSGSQQGGIYSYSGVNPANPKQTYIIDTVIKQNRNGLRTVPVLYDFKNDNKLDMIVGNTRGGLNFYTVGNGYIGLNKIQPEIDFGLFPNPTSNIINIQLDNNIYRKNSMSIYNLLGELIETKRISTSRTVIDVSNYPKGVYLINVKSEQGSKTKRFIVQ
ncbi:T9SS type A sorting domain-containing protein, partial [Flavobacteriales bacterium]|nr:T9SS type A sorting domain-containing protein [Flavobacteriales bacterium]